MILILWDTQCDQVADGQACHAADMEAYCKEKGYVAWFETSAKENINVDEAARFLISRVIDKFSVYSSADRFTFFGDLHHDFL